MSRQYFFGCACEGFVCSVQLAACIDWLPYIGDTTGYALAQLRHVLRQGRALGPIQTGEDVECAS